MYCHTSWNFPEKLRHVSALQGGIRTSACSRPRVPDHVNHPVLQMADLSLPMALCEPVTDMQRRADFLEYVHLLHEVRGTCHGPLQG